MPSENKERLRVSVANGKYTVIQLADGGTHALRYGSHWRDCVGDGLILALAQEIEQLREIVALYVDADGVAPEYREQMEHAIKEAKI